MTSFGSYPVGAAVLFIKKWGGGIATRLICVRQACGRSGGGTQAASKRETPAPRRRPMRGFAVTCSLHKPALQSTSTSLFQQISSLRY